ncbi:MAG TPA: 2-oxo-4-hydroxy-4-carboxy-5-ureidoimidazoline decarboxylase [Gemmatimonadales bacterium]|nr:2-oxo-4-hydroxy-4-carboxy-5-ureidoimidazoline decarboxylase [Gemmatimonadales bacterium]
MADRVSMAAFDTMPESEAAELLRSCCGSSRWVKAMVARRPFRSLGALAGAAAEVWRRLAPADWLEAFAHHPRIGERAAPVSQDDRARTWSAGEQAGLESAAGDVRAALAEVNAEYERRFGHGYIVCATGRSAEEMLDLARARLGNDPDVELSVAAGEQGKITRIRLEKLFA